MSINTSSPRIKMLLAWGALAVASFTVPVASAAPFLAATRAVRGLAVSDDCEAATMALFEDEANGLATAFSGLASDVMQAGSCTGEDCTMDFSQLPSASDFVAACEDAGGMNIMVSVEMNCFSFTWGYQNIMDCVAADCGMDGIEEELTEAVAATESTVESETEGMCSATLSHLHSDVESDGNGGIVFPNGDDEDSAAWSLLRDMCFVSSAIMISSTMVFV